MHDDGSGTRDDVRAPDDANLPDDGGASLERATPTLGATTPPLFLASSGDLESLELGDSFELTGPEAHHAANVHRLRPGEILDVSDGAGLRLRCQVAPSRQPGAAPPAHGAATPPSFCAPPPSFCAKSQNLEPNHRNPKSGKPSTIPLVIRARHQEPASENPIALVQALAKSDRDLIAIATAVEVGVDQIIPWQAERSIVVWKGERAEKSRAKWESAVQTAAKQARRAWVPEVTAPMTTKSLVALTRETVASGGSGWVLDGHGATPISEAQLPIPGQKLLIVVGPEGGISGAELEALTAVGAVTVRLGPHVMRTSTAGPIAVALAAQRQNRW